MLSSGRVKTELFENADVKASICDIPEHAHGSLGITRGHFACLFSFIEARTAEFESSCVFVWTEVFSKTLLVWMQIFFYTYKKDAFSKRSGYVWRGPESKILFTFVWCWVTKRKTKRDEIFACDFDNTLYITLMSIHRNLSKARKLLHYYQISWQYTFRRQSSNCNSISCQCQRDQGM